MLDAMLPFSLVTVLTPETPIAEAVGLLAHENSNQPPVMDNTRFVGILTRDLIVNYLFTRNELKL